jgi:hypothetical protein
VRSTCASISFIADLSTPSIISSTAGGRSLICQVCRDHFGAATQIGMAFN